MAPILRQRRLALGGIDGLPKHLRVKDQHGNRNQHQLLHSDSGSGPALRLSPWPAFAHSSSAASEAPRTQIAFRQRH